MLDDRLRIAVWQALLDAERFGRYYGRRARAHQLYHRILRSILLFAAVGGVARFLDILPDETELISNVAGIAIIVLVIWDFMMDDGKKAVILHAISVECGDYYLRLRSLWMSLNQEECADQTAIRAELRAIEEGMLRVTARAGHADIRDTITATNVQRWRPTRSYPPDPHRMEPVMAKRTVFRELGRPPRPPSPPPPPPPPKPSGQRTAAALR